MRSLLSIVLFALVVLVAGTGARPAFASGKGADSPAPVVLAENDRGGIFGLFNSSKKTGKRTVKPYDYSAQTAGRNRRHIPSGDLWKNFKAKREADMMAKMESARIAVDQNATKREEAVRVALAKRREAWEAAPEDKAAQDNSGKKMVYDPRKAWTYDPNRPKDRTEPARIYNTR